LTVEQVLPRRTVVVRASVGGRSNGQVLVANHDVAMVVEPLHPEPDLGRVERLLALAWQSGARPVIVLTKADLVPDADHIAADVADPAPGVDVHAVSAVTGDGVEVLRPYVVPGQTVAMLGPSGAGKSTLTNALAGVEVMATRELRGDGKGRHTTAHRELVLLPGGGVVIDTPGLRKVGLFAAAEGLGRVFDDIEELELQCRFNDCQHDTEPGCAVLAAIESGELDARRLDSWRKLGREMLRMELRQDARLRAAQVARWKQLTKDHRSLEARRGKPRA
jgi:ribosome biogenesis GTPase